MTNTNWKEDILQSYNIKLIKDMQELQEVYENNRVLFTTRCSKTKIKAVGVFPPHQLYTNRENIQFYSVMNKNNFNFGIISDLHGVIFDDEAVSPYDKHPSKLSPTDFIRLGQRIKDKLDSRNYDTIVFFNSSPKLSLPYFKILKETRLNIYYVTKLELIDFKKPEIGIVMGDIRPLREIIEQVVSTLSYGKPYTLKYLIAEVAKFNLPLKESYLSIALRKCVVNNKSRIVMGDMLDAFYTNGIYYYKYHTDMKHIPVYHFDKELKKQNKAKNKEDKKNKKSLF